jgi:Cu/Ag efflux pump CusA
MRPRPTVQTAGRLLLFLLLSVTLLPAHAAAGTDAVVVDVTAACPGFSPEEVERQVTTPLEVLMAGTPRLDHIRSQSLPGLAWLRLEFRAGTAIDRARQEVINHLSFAPALPPGVTPQLSAATLPNQLLRYTLRGPRDPKGKDVYTPSDLRALQDGTLEREFHLVPGVAAVVSAGGTVKRYEVQPDSDRLRRYGISLHQVQTAIAEANTNAGGDYVNQGRAALTVRAVGLLGGGADPLRQVLDLKDPREAAARLRSQEQHRIGEIRSLVVASVNKVPVRVEDVAEAGRLAPGEELGRKGVVVGHQPRAGLVGLSRPGAPDEDDLVQGVVLLRPGQDRGETLQRVLARVKELNERPGQLLPGVRIAPYFQRTSAPQSAEEIVWVRGELPVSISAEQAAEHMRRMRRLLLGHPEVREVVSQLGRAEGSMGPMGNDHVQAVVLLRPPNEWPLAPGKDPRRTWRQLTQDMEAELGRELPGVTWHITPDFRDEMQAVFTAGAGQGLLKIFGRDLEGLERLADKAARELGACKGVSGVQIVHCLGRLNLDLRIDREKCKRWGISVADANMVIQTAVGGLRATQMVEGASTFDVTLCWPARMSDGEQAVLDLPVDVVANQAPRGQKDKGPENSIAAQPRLRLRDLVSPLGDDGEPDPKGSFARRAAAAIYREQGRRFLAIRFRLPEKGGAEVLAAVRKKLAPLFEAPYRAEWEGGR